MKKTTALLLAVLLAATLLAGCDQTTGETETPTGDPGEYVGDDSEVEDFDIPDEAPIEEPAEPWNYGQAGGVTDVIDSGYSASAFSDAPVSREDLDRVLLSGATAPSARNEQPWRFVAVTDSSLFEGLGLRGATSGNVAIIVAGLEDAPEGVNVDYDCGLATQNMYLTAQSLGLGAHIYTGPVSGVNGNKSLYGIPEGYEAVAILQIGHPEADAVTTPSERRSLADSVTYLETDGGDVEQEEPELETEGELGEDTPDDPIENSEGEEGQEEE